MSELPEIYQQMFKLDRTMAAKRALHRKHTANSNQSNIMFSITGINATGRNNAVLIINNFSFVKLQIAKPVSAHAVEIYFPGGIHLLFHEPVSSSYLKALIS